MSKSNESMLTWRDALDIASMPSTRRVDRRVVGSRIQYRVNPRMRAHLPVEDVILRSSPCVPELRSQRRLRHQTCQMRVDEVSGDFMGEWVKTPKYWKWRSFTKVKIPIPVCHNSLYDEFIASIMQSGDLDCTLSDMVISYLMHSREKVNPTIINSNVRVLTYIMDADTDGFRLILKINVVERSFEGPLNSSAPLLRRPAVDDDFNDYKNGGDHPINMEDNFMHMEEFSSNSQDDEEDRGTASQPGHFFSNGINFYCG
ncbi:hypothetical protein FXO38_23681 [Capsicum annuum]|nr:hypothetical protein FXO38_23681 [Capsicum annuum]